MGSRIRLGGNMIKRRGGFMTNKKNQQRKNPIKKPSKNAAKHNTNKVRQEKINKNTEEISEKIYNKENYEEPYYVDAARKIDEMKKESYSYQDEVRRGTVNAEEQEKYFEELEEKEGGMLGKLKKKFFN